MRQDFAGREGQVWFVGVVEGRSDPTHSARMKVRIIGWHDESTVNLPTDKLPWALVSLPTNNSRHLSLPKEGDWVHGFFLDGHAGQQPLVIGVIPGIISTTPKTPTGATQVLAALEAQLVIETAKLNAMIAGQSSTSQKQKVAAKNSDIIKLQNKIDAAVVIRDRVQQQYDVASIYAKQSIGFNLATQKGIVTDLQNQMVVLTTELSLLSETYTPSQIEKQKAVVKQLQSEISELKLTLNRATPIGFCDVATYAEVDKRPNPIEGVVTDRKDEPSLPAQSRGDITKTGIDISNANREHTCDFAIYVRTSMEAAKFGTSQIAQAIRLAIQAVIKALSPTPGGSAIAEQIRTFARLIKRAADMLKEINEYIDGYVTYVAKINAVIQYILSLPANLLAMFKTCLSQAYAELAEGLRLIVGDFSGMGGEGNAFSEITDATKTALTATKELVTNAAKLYSGPATLLGTLIGSGKTLSETEQKELISSLFPDSPGYDKTSFSTQMM